MGEFTHLLGDYVKYNFSAPLFNAQQKPMTISETDLSPWTAKLALQAAILVDTAKNEDSKMKRYELFLKLRGHVDEQTVRDANDDKDSATDYTAAEIGLLQASAFTYTTLFAGQLSHILDQKS